jgi:hypothetical protein
MAAVSIGSSYVQGTVVHLHQIKNAVSTRLAMRLSRIESGTDGWQGTAWLLERLYPTRFSKPEIQISQSNSFNENVNSLSITISPEEAREIEARAAPEREKVRKMVEDYQLRRSNGDQGDKKLRHRRCRWRFRKNLPIICRVMARAQS